jgi:hypothetical protein
MFELVLNEWIISRRRSKALLQRCPLTDTSKSPTITAFSLLLSVCVAAARKLVMAPSSSATSYGGGFVRAVTDRLINTGGSRAPSACLKVVLAY